MQKFGTFGLGFCAQEEGWARIGFTIGCAQTFEVQELWFVTFMFRGMARSAVPNRHLM